MPDRPGDESMLLYDADCGFCTRAARVSTRVLRSVTTTPMQSFDLASLGVDTARASKEIPFRSRTGRVSYGSEAIADALIANGGAVAVAGRVLRLWPISAVANYVYRVVARNRYRLSGSTGTCSTS